MEKWFYFISGVQNWAMLFPAGIFGALVLLAVENLGGVFRAAEVAKHPVAQAEDQYLVALHQVGEGLVIAMLGL